MSAQPNDIAAATREAIIERYENTAVRDALAGARDGSLQPAEGFFDLLAKPTVPPEMTATLREIDKQG